MKSCHLVIWTAVVLLQCSLYFIISFSPMTSHYCTNYYVFQFSLLMHGICSSVATFCSNSILHRLSSAQQHVPSFIATRIQPIGSNLRNDLLISVVPLLLFFVIIFVLYFQWVYGVRIFKWSFYLVVMSRFYEIILFLSLWQLLSYSIA